MNNKQIILVLVSVQLVFILFICFSCANKHEISTYSSETVHHDQFVANPNGTVIDTKTGLMWAAKDYGDVNWKLAKKYCENLKLAGFEDWRMPKSHELKSLLIDPGPINKYGYQMTDLIEVNGWLWADEVLRKTKDRTFVRSYHFVGGVPYEFPGGQAFRQRVLPVRNTK